METIAQISTYVNASLHVPVIVPWGRNKLMWFEAPGVKQIWSTYPRILYVELAIGRDERTFNMIDDDSFCRRRCNAPSWTLPVDWNDHYNQGTELFACLPVEAYLEHVGST